jgi:ABC-2 type transport system ATP-binding protein
MSTDHTPRPLGARLENATVRYGRSLALDAVSFDIEAGSITGLLGRNGSGKTTALSLLAGFRAPSTGTVTVGGADPMEDEDVATSVCLIRESGDVIGDSKVADTLEVAEMFRPRWDRELAHELLDRFEVPLTKNPNALSRGKRSVFGAVIGLATRAPLTMLDEIHLGMDAATRVEFYELLLADYAAHPRTIVISSHLISEVETMLENVVLLDRGSVVHAGGTEDLRAQGATLTGRDDAVREAAAEMRVLSERTLGPTTELTVLADLDAAARADLATRGIGVGHVGLQDVVIHMTGRTS